MSVGRPVHDAAVVAVRAHAAHPAHQCARLQVCVQQFSDAWRRRVGMHHDGAEGRRAGNAEWQGADPVRLVHAAQWVFGPPPGFHVHDGVDADGGAVLEVVDR
ncbi:hypothetical protein DAVIS_00106 [Mycobacterium marinum]|uniref:Uncharacterized protein n=1 Tax=Mycobacterium marinum TaxID=1781 RepID=A0A3E2N311_MYCMR|nr:hypothetical protein DAVIS_00106 [Mycobacterium marinum]